jgi:type II secretory pathway pseudopilin PulG
LVEVAVVAAIVGVLAAVAIPVALTTARKHASQTTPQLVASALSRGRDAAREKLRCVTVLVREPAQAGGNRTVAAYLHDTSSCARDFVNASNPGANATTVAEVSLPADTARALTMLRPASGCVGTPGSVTCYEREPTDRFVLRPDGSTDLPYRIRLERVDGSVDSFFVFPQTGTIRLER